MKTITKYILNPYLLETSHIKRSGGQCNTTNPECHLTLGLGRTNLSKTKRVCLPTITVMAAACCETVNDHKACMVWHLRAHLTPESGFGQRGTVCGGCNIADRITQPTMCDN